jgi:hypothetical protein
LAAATGSFAQSAVTLSGSLAAGYASSTTGTTVTKGFGLDTASFQLGATEDLGGGLTVSGAMGIEGVAGGASATANQTMKPNNASMAIAGGFGKVEFLAAKESGNGIIGAGSAGAPIKLDVGKFAAGAGNNDNVIYTAPKFGDVTVKVLLGEDGAKNDNFGVGKGIVAAKVVYVDYAAGPLTAGINFTNYTTSTNALTSHSGKSSRTRMTATYDLGMAKLGFGYSTGGVFAGGKNDQTSLGVSVPAGAWSFGAGLARASVTDLAAAAGTANTDTTANSGTAAGSFTQTVSSVGAQYTFSKRTSFKANYFTTNEKAGFYANGTSAKALAKSGYQMLLISNF